jgi:hypothetical protein
MLISLLNLSEWGFGGILMAILTLNIFLFLVLTFAPRIHNTITASVRKFIDCLAPRSGTTKV